MKIKKGRNVDIEVEILKQISVKFPRFKDAINVRYELHNPFTSSPKYHAKQIAALRNSLDDIGAGKEISKELNKLGRNELFSTSPVGKIPTIVEEDLSYQMF